MKNVKRQNRRLLLVSAFTASLVVVLSLSVASTPAWAGEAERYFSDGITYLKKGQHDAAVAAFKEAIRLRPNFGEAQFNLGLIYMLTGISKTIIVPKGAPEGTPMPALLSQPLLPSYKSARVAGEEGFHIRDMERVDAAVSSLKEAIRLKSELADAYILLGAIYKLKGEWDAAISSYKEAVRLRPNNADLYYELGTLFHIKGQPDEAIGLYKEALGIEQNHMAAHIALFEAYSETTQYDAALDLINGMEIFSLLNEINVPEGYKKHSEDTQTLLLEIDSETMEVELQKKLMGALKKDPYLTDSQVEWLIRIEDILERANKSYGKARISLILSDNMPDTEERKSLSGLYWESEQKATELHDKATRDLKTLITRVQVRKKQPATK